ncbi:unnamed protein product [Acanthoscelides obtectus]|uniref:Uncharacterized protein n=1 Tax=Acanthoscelides obtectus TaxID=200917 RepID=A0A9P0NTB4_ACAOB|nr:unnamed protein product [Acanthoscelides obtectus]CAK1672861.1 hypothetical protein AOBTE_LOCUS29120 [Acanthoscelides obtectus]
MSGLTVALRPMKVVHLEPKVTRHDAAVGRQPSKVSHLFEFDLLDYFCL